jgi:glucan phosphoethanolaminetransferase (alkaline phosphatase superfamily)
MATRFQAGRSTVAVLLVLALEVSLLAALTRTWRRFFLLTVPLFILSLPFATYTVVFGVPPGRALALVLAGTSLEELTGFAQLWRGSYVVWLGAALALVYLVLAWRQPSQPIFTGQRLRIAGRSIPASRLLVLLLVPAAVYAAADPGEFMDGIGYDPLLGSAMFVGGELPRARADMSGASVAKVPYHARWVGGAEVHILVVGESARRDSWSAYGYQRQTTPYLDGLKHEVIFLRHAMADANLTSWSVPIIMTGITPDRFDAAAIHGSLFDLAKEAGYETSWLVNQDIGMTMLLGIQPDHLVYPPEIQTSPFGRYTLDESLLPAYRREISRAGRPRFIGLHIMGSHWEYAHRYPAGFRHFGPSRQLSMVSLFDSRGVGAASILDAYDNTILYTDWLLHELIEEARTLRVPATLTYFPDHGEDLEALDGRVGHGAPVYTPHAFEIPAFVWVNAAYEQAHPQKVAALRSNSSKEVRSHDVFTTVADLMGIRWPDFVAQRSFASDQFAPDLAMKYSAGGVFVTGTAHSVEDPHVAGRPQGAGAVAVSVTADSASAP